MNTTTEQNKAVIRRFFEAWNSRQPEAFNELVAPDVVRHCQATPGLDVYGVHTFYLLIGTCESVDSSIL